MAPTVDPSKPPVSPPATPGTYSRQRSPEDLLASSSLRPAPGLGFTGPPNSNIPDQPWLVTPHSTSSTFSVSPLTRLSTTLASRRGIPTTLQQTALASLQLLESATTYGNPANTRVKLLRAGPAARGGSVPQIQPTAHGTIAQRRKQKKMQPREASSPDPHAQVPQSLSSQAYSAPRDAMVSPLDFYASNRPRLAQGTPSGTQDQAARLPPINMVLNPPQTGQYQFMQRSPVRTMSNLLPVPIEPPVLREQLEVPSSFQRQLSHDYFFACLVRGVNIFSDREQKWLCHYIDPTKEQQRILVYSLANRSLPQCRNNWLTYALAEWIYTRDKDNATISQMMRQDVDFLEYERADFMLPDVVLKDWIDPNDACETVMGKEDRDNENAEMDDAA
ncbi:hypothetical protein F4677DRAFT_443633 [Hypoxylon crocopeplum]|nr:hypothetical protein F4677DRAFT_443633 [Hypoxylon crocopeplum]